MIGSLPTTRPTSCPHDGARLVRDSHDLGVWQVWRCTACKFAHAEQKATR